MSVPGFGDLGKLARDLLRSGYTFDRVRMKLTKPIDNFEVQAEAHVNQNLEPAISGLIKYDTQDCGKISGKISSEGPFVLEYSCNGKLSENIDLLAGYSINMKDSFQSLKFATQYHNSMIHTGLSLTKDFDRNVDLLGSIVFKSNNFMVGFQSGYDTNTSMVTKNNLGLAYDYNGFITDFRFANIPKEFGLSVFCPVNENLKVAVESKITNNEDLNSWYIGAGFSYKLTEECKLKMKFDKNLQLGANMQFQINDGLLLTLATNLDLSNIKSGEHKIGVGLDISG